MNANHINTSQKIHDSNHTNTARQIIHTENKMQQSAGKCVKLL